MKQSNLVSPLPFSELTFGNQCLYICGVGIGSGLAPKAPGTCGSLVVLPLLPLWLYLGFTHAGAVLLFSFLFGIYCCGRTASLMGFHDDGRIVWDEFVGQSIALLPLTLVPALPPMHYIAWTILGFALFRLFHLISEEK